MRPSPAKRNLLPKKKISKSLLLRRRDLGMRPSPAKRKLLPKKKI
jgi:hypothetical protein